VPGQILLHPGRAGHCLRIRGRPAAPGKRPMPSWPGRGPCVTEAGRAPEYPAAPIVPSHQRVAGEDLLNECGARAPRQSHDKDGRALEGVGRSRVRCVKKTRAQQRLAALGLRPSTSIPPNSGSQRGGRFVTAGVNARRIPQKGAVCPRVLCPGRKVQVESGSRPRGGSGASELRAQSNRSAPS